MGAELRAGTCGIVSGWGVTTVLFRIPSVSGDARKATTVHVPCLYSTELAPWPRGLGTDNVVCTRFLAQHHCSSRLTTQRQGTGPCVSTQVNHWYGTGMPSPHRTTGQVALPLATIRKPTSGRTAPCPTTASCPHDLPSHAPCTSTPPLLHAWKESSLAHHNACPIRRSVGMAVQLSTHHTSMAITSHGDHKWKITADAQRTH